MSDGPTKGEENNRQFVLTVAALWWKNKFKVKCRKIYLSLHMGCYYCFSLILCAGTAKQNCQWIIICDYALIM